MWSCTGVKKVNDIFYLTKIMWDEIEKNSGQIWLKMNKEMWFSIMDYCNAVNIKGHIIVL